MWNKLLGWLGCLLTPVERRNKEVDKVIEDLKENYAEAVYTVDYDISRGSKGEIILTPRITRVK